MMELFRSHPYLPKRVEALRLFARTHYYLKTAGHDPQDGEGQSLGWCDAEVKQLVSVLRRKKKQGGGDDNRQDKE